MARQYKRRTKKRAPKRTLKSRIIAVVVSVLALIGAAHYYDDLKPFIHHGADAIAEWLTSSPPLEGDVLRIADGDTVTIAGEINDIKVRLYGIDAPESDQPHGAKSTEALKAMIDGKNVKLTIIDIDRYGRSVGVIELDGVNINEQMLLLGHAWYYEAYCKKNFCKRWQEIARQAKNNRIGLWSDPNPVPPWNYRNNH